MAYRDLLLYSNPRKTRRHRRNPSMTNPTLTAPKTWMMGADLMDVAAVGAGIVASAYLPTVLKLKNVTQTDKAIRIGAAALTAVAMGMAFSKLGKPSAGKMALLGGLGGTAIAAINTFAKTTIPTSLGARSAAHPFVSGGTAIGGTYPAPATQPQFSGTRLV